MSARHEDVIVACVLAFGAEALDEMEAKGLLPRHFESRQHAKTYEAALALRDAGDPIGPMALQDRAGALIAPLLERAKWIVVIPSEGPYAAREVVAASVRRDADSAIAAARGFLREGDHPSEVVEDLIAALADIVEGKRDETRNLAELIPQVLEQIEQGGVPAIGTGLDDLDEILSGGIRAGELHIVGARPGMGKSALALSIARYVAQSAGPGLIFSLEMSAEQSTRRLLASTARTSLKHPDWSKLQGAAGSLEQIELWYHDKAGVGLPEVFSIARATKRRRTLEVVVVDYLQLMKVGEGENRATALGDVSGGLKRMARDLDVPVIALAQLNRQVEQRPGGRPRLSDLRDSGSIEQDADAVWLLWRPEKYLADASDYVGKAEVQIAKQRDGRTGSVWLSFEEEHVLFGNLDRDEWPTFRNKEDRA